MRIIALTSLLVLPLVLAALPVAAADGLECLPYPPNRPICYAVTTSPEPCVFVWSGRMMLLDECVPLRASAADAAPVCASTPWSNPTWACVERAGRQVCAYGAHGWIPFHACLP